MVQATLPPGRLLFRRPFLRPSTSGRRSPCSFMTAGRWPSSLRRSHAEAPPPPPFHHPFRSQRKRVPLPPPRKETSGSLSPHAPFPSAPSRPNSGDSHHRQTLVPAAAPLGPRPQPTLLSSGVTTAPSPVHTAKLVLLHQSVDVDVARDFHLIYIPARQNSVPESLPGF